MIISIGTDIVNSARIERAIARHGQRFVQRIYTPAEQAYCDGATGERRIIRYANRFAAKEALFKILGTQAGIAWQEMEVVRGVHGKPSVLLHGRAKEVAQAMVACYTPPLRGSGRAEAQCAKGDAWGEGNNVIAPHVSFMDFFRKSITQPLPLKGGAKIASCEKLTYQFHLSLSDDTPYSVAFVVMEAVAPSFMCATKE